jgi:hypothetical protein
MMTNATTAAGDARDPRDGRDPRDPRDPRDGRYERVARVVAGVVRSALEVTGATAIVLLDAESPEGVLFSRIARDHALELTSYADSATTLTAHPANKTALLVGEFFPRVDLLPLGDLYATQVAQLTDGWSADQAVQVLAAEVGGLAARGFGGGGGQAGGARRCRATRRGCTAAAWSACRARCSAPGSGGSARAWCRSSGRVRSVSTC